MSFKEIAEDLLAKTLHGGPFPETVAAEVCDPNGGSVAKLAELLAEHCRSRRRSMSDAAFASFVASFVACFAREEAKLVEAMLAEREAQS